ncbi:MAG: aminopeptidase P family protein, partial [Thermodesulfatator sp.]
MHSVPAKEISRRIQSFQHLLLENSIDLAVIRQNADLFYLTGTVQDAHLIVPAQGEPAYLVWRVPERARQESPIKTQVAIRSLRLLPSILRDLGHLDVSVLGLEMDVLPATLYRLYHEDIWPKAQVKDISPIIRFQRRIKSPWEIQRIQEACLQVKEALEIVPGILKEGITELELSSAIESELR